MVELRREVKWSSVVNEAFEWCSSVSDGDGWEMNGGANYV